jgi:hypothetical protein
MSTDIEARTSAAMSAFAATVTPAQPSVDELLAQGATPIAPGPRRWSHGWVAAAAAAIAAVGIAAAVVIARSPSDDAPAPSAPPVFEQTEPSRPASTAVTAASTTSLPGSPTTSAASSPASGAVSNAPVALATIEVSARPTSIVFGFGALWLAGGTDRQVTRWDPGSRLQTASLDVPFDVTQLAVGPDGVYACAGDAVARIEPDASTTTSTSAPCDALAVAFGSVWALDHEGASVRRLDPSDLSTTATIDVANDGRSIAAGVDRVWVGGAPSAGADGSIASSLVAIEPADESVAAPIALPAEVGSVVDAGPSGLWLATFDRETSTTDLARLDLDSGSIEEVRNSIEADYSAISVVDGHVAVQSASGQLWIIDPTMGTSARWYDPTLESLPFEPGGAVPTGRGPRLAFDGGNLWDLTPRGDGTSRLYVIDPAGALTSAPDEPHATATVPTSAGRGRLVAAFGRIWQAGTFDNTLVGVDPASGAVTSTWEGMPGPIVAASEDSLYVCGQGSTVRLEPATGETLATSGHGCFVSLAVGFGSVWVPRAGGIVRLDATTLEQQATIDDVAAGWGIEVAHGSVWVADGRGNDPDRQGHVTRIDPATNTVTAVIPTPSRARMFEATPDALWVTLEPIAPADVGVVRIDPSTNAITTELTGLVDATDLTSVGELLAVSSYFGPLQLIDSASATTVAAFDPFFSGSPGDRSAIAWDGRRLWNRIPYAADNGIGVLIAIDLGRYTPDG